ncbi:Peptidyl-prolyl cis-trans isomerase CYP18-3 [Phytophthora citrophthora]|uniref:Peptidyl-prolyl cis-trans isomerase CYP18-3 n=1 Tax=Phytophthora citrophthora TaxID=4793 RepID=A0AAD9GUZ8_9STRA|nr:Peptidyl-prolyl cis-trans isomerase CYP18-3 [Phytophthora citrophthora]
MDTAATKLTTSNVPLVLPIETSTERMREAITTVKAAEQRQVQATTPSQKLVPTALRIPTAIRIPTAVPLVAATFPPATPAEAPHTAARPHPTACPRRLKTATSRLFSYENDPKFLKRFNMSELEVDRMMVIRLNLQPSWLDGKHVVLGQVLYDDLPHLAVFEAEGSASGRPLSPIVVTDAGQASGAGFTPTIAMQREQTTTE